MGQLALMCTKGREGSVNARQNKTKQDLKKLRRTPKDMLFL
jgi:hypothetical protein